MRRLFRSLVVRIAAPVLLFSALLGAALYAFVLTTITDHVRSSIDRDLQFLSRQAFDICSQAFDETIRSGAISDPKSLAVKQALTLGKLEDWMRNQDLSGLVLDKRGGRILAETALPYSPQAILAKRHTKGKTLLLETGKRDFYVHYVEFSPWNWVVALLKSKSEYAKLTDEVFYINVITTILLALSAIFLILLLHHAIKNPIYSIVEPLKKGVPPKYKGTDVFEFLSTSIARMMESLRKSEHKFRTIVESSPVGMHMFTLDPDGKLVLTGANRAADRILALDHGLLTGHTLEQAFPALAGTGMLEGLQQIAGHGGSWDADEVKLLGEGSGKVFEVHAFVTEPGMITTMFQDVTERLKSQEQIAYQAHHDSLTGLPNRPLFNDRLGMAIARAQRKNQKLAVIFIDLDHFKNINDGLGHAVGDLLLQSVANRLGETLREEDTVARLGGDEFIVLLQEVSDSDYAVSVARRILAKLVEPVPLSGKSLHISASIGITIFPQDGRDIESLVSNADMAMYKAKEDGRNGYRLFTAAMNEQLTRRLTVEDSLRHALENQEFELYYQPVVSLSSHKVVGAEALVRWQHPKDGLTLPGRFIPIAEESGLIVPLGEWVLSEACGQTQRWLQDGYGELDISVNLSPRQFLDRNLVNVVGGILDQCRLEPLRLVLEVTENVFTLNEDEAVNTLRKLSMLGPQIAMDDFGRGYSSLYFLKRFPITTLKIDRYFVRGIPRDQDYASIVQTIVTMGRSLKLQVVAEGVETQTQLDFIKELGYDMIQGFFFSPPLPADDFVNYLEKHNSRISER